MCSVVLRILLEPCLISCTRFSRPLIGHSRPFHYQTRDLVLESCNLPRLGNASLGMEPYGSHPLVQTQGYSPEQDQRSTVESKDLGCSVFARRYLRNLVDLFSSPYLDVSVRAVPTTGVICATRKCQIIKRQMINFPHFCVHLTFSI
jgi:hypothetical protein